MKPNKASNKASNKAFNDDLKLYILKFVGMILLGIVSGLAVYSSAMKSEDDNAIAYFFTLSIIFLIIGLIIFLIRYFKLKRFYKNDK